MLGVCALAALLIFAAHLANQTELGLKVDIVRQLQVLDEAGRLHVVAMGNDELLVLRGRGDILIQFVRAQRPVAQRHGHGLAFRLTEHQPVAARELRRHLLRPLELVDHLAFGDADAAKREREIQFRHVDLHIHLANADFAGKRVVAAIAALGGVSESKEKTLVAARQRLKALVAIHGKLRRLAGDVAGLAVFRQRTVFLNQAFIGENVGHTRHGFFGLAARLGRCRFGVFGQFRVKQAVRVVEGGAEKLPARQILVGGGDAPLDQHGRRVDGARIAEARQGGAVGAQKEDRLDHVAARLLHSKRCKPRIVKRAFGHDAVDGERKLAGDLFERDGGHIAVAAATVGQKPMRVLDGGFAALDGYIHGSGLLIGDAGGTGQGREALAADQDQVDPAWETGVVLRPLSGEMARQRMRRKARFALDAGALEHQFLAA